MNARPLRGRNPRVGFTLIEVLAASMVLGIGLVGVGSLVTYGTISHQKSVNYTVAAARATKELERIREAGYSGAVAGPTLFPSSTYVIANSTQVTFTVPELTAGHGLITLDEDPEAKATKPSTGLPYNNLKTVKVKIFWGGSRSLQGSYEALTLLANRPK